LKQKHFIDAHKGATPVVVTLLIALYGQWRNPTALLYLALHGTYGILWITKSRVFPDRQWEQKCSLWYGLYLWFGLALYWISPWLLTMRGVRAPAWYQATCVSMYAVGVFLHFVADMQKHVALTIRPEHMVMDGLFSRCRNINYFGELLIYSGFGLLAMHWAPAAVLAFFLLVIWLPNMRRKDRSLSRYPQFADWKKSSSFFIPFVW